MSNEPLHLTEYEVQVLIGTSIHGCPMQPDRVFRLDLAWDRLFAFGLIDRTDGLAIITGKGRSVVSAVLAAATLSPAHVVDAVQRRGK